VTEDRALAAGPGAGGAPGVPDPAGAASGRPSRRSLVVRTLVGTAISVVALWLVFRTVDVGQALSILRGASLPWVVVMLVAMLADMTARTLRWHVILAPVADISILRTFQYITTGYAANNVLPARLGEVVRAHYLGDREGVSRSTALGTIVVERVIDFAVLVALAAGSLVLIGARSDMTGAVLVGVAVSVALIAGLVILVVGHRIPGAARAEARLEARLPRVHSIVTTFRAGTAVAGRPRTLVFAVVLSLVAWSCSIVAFGAGAQALGIELTMSQTAFLAAGVNLITAVPAGPGFVGTWELAAVKILGTYGIGGDTAFAYALLVHVSTLALTSIAGAASFLRIGWLPTTRGRAVGAAVSPPSTPPPSA
jgi:hypothetical protein